MTLRTAYDPDYWDNLRANSSASVPPVDTQPTDPLRGPVWPFPPRLLDYPSHPPAARVPRPPLPDTPALF